MDWEQYYEPVDSGLFEDCVTVPINIFKSYYRIVQNTGLDTFKC